MADDLDSQAWAWSEFRDARLGDARLVKRLVKITADFSHSPEQSIPGAFSGDRHATKAAYRFLDNDDVLPEAILAAHREATLRRIETMDDKFILAVQDTTYLNFTSHRATTGLGSIGAPGLQGCLHHGVLALEPKAGVPLGLLDSRAWARDDGEQAGKPAAAARRAIEEKESGRWLEAMTHTAEVVPAGVRVLTVADREADIFEFFSHARGLGQDILIRANHDRKVVSDGEAKGLWDAAVAAEPLGIFAFNIPRDEKHNRPARTVMATLQIASVEIKPPTRLAAQHLQRIAIRAVLLQEVSAPAGQEPVQWLLLTTRPVETLKDAYQCVTWYTYRWRIERLHFTLKSGGGNYEKLQLRTADRLWRALAVYLVVAWRILYIDLVARALPEAPCTTFLTSDEWQALCCHHLKKRRPPAEPPDARTAVRWIAALGGFLGRKGDGDPGVKTLWRGFRRLQDLVQMWRIMRPE